MGTFLNCDDAIIVHMLYNSVTFSIHDKPQPTKVSEMRGSDLKMLPVCCTPKMCIRGGGEGCSGDTNEFSEALIHVGRMEEEKES